MEIAFGFRVVGTETVNAAIAGNATTKLAATLAKRSGVIVSNISGTYSVFVRLVPRGATAPTYTTLYSLITIPAGSYAIIPASESVDVYANNSSAAATTSSVIHQDFAY